METLAKPQTNEKPSLLVSNLSDIESQRSKPKLIKNVISQYHPKNEDMMYYTQRGEREAFLTMPETLLTDLDVNEDMSKKYQSQHPQTSRQY